MYLGDRLRGADGVPVVGMHYEPGENDRRMMNDMLDRLADVAAAAEAFDLAFQDYRDADGVDRTPAWRMIGTSGWATNRRPPP